MIHRLSLKLVNDHLFAAIDDEPSRLRTEDYRTLTIHQWETTKGRKKLLNIVQLSRPLAMQILMFRYAEYVHRVALTVVEPLMEEYEFGFGDVRMGAPFLVLEHARVGSAATIVRWLKKNTRGDCQTVEGPNFTRVSFSDVEDFALARINFS